MFLFKRLLFILAKQSIALLEAVCLEDEIACARLTIKVRQAECVALCLPILKGK